MEARGAVVKVASQGRQSTTLYRPIQLLYPLEVTENQNIVQNNPEQSLNPRMEVNNTLPDEQELPTRRSKRRAALEARDKIVAQTLDDWIQVYHLHGQWGEDVGDWTRLLYVHVYVYMCNPIRTLVIHH